jgi:hypothetical protein
MDFNTILNTRAAEIEKPAPQPEGTYIWKVTKNYKQSKISSAKGEWDVIELPVVAIGVDQDAEDVDADLLAEYGSLNQSSNRVSFMFSTDPSADTERARTADQLKRFLLDTLRVEGGEDSTIKELLAMSPGCEFRAQAKQKTADNGNVNVNLAGYMPLAD